MPRTCIGSGSSCEVRRTEPTSSTAMSECAGWPRSQSTAERTESLASMANRSTFVARSTNPIIRKACIPPAVSGRSRPILHVQRAGFNLLRIHIKIDDPLVLYYADTMGILLMCDFPNFGEGRDNDVGRRRYEVMMRRVNQRDFNHPSIVAWCLFNETWGFGGQREFVKLINPSPLPKRSSCRVRGERSE